MTTNHFDISTLTALNALAQQDKVELTAGQAEILTKAIKKNLNLLPAYIMVCLKGKAYKAMGYSSVNEWALAEFGLSRSRIYQLNAVASAELAMRTRFKLSAGFTIPEGQFRPLNSDLESVLNTIADDLTDSDAESESAREGVVTRSISKIVMALECKEREAKAVGTIKVATGITDNTPKADTASGNNVVAFTQRPMSTMGIESVALSYELAVVKARDTGKVLMCLSPETDADLLRDALLDAETVIAELLAFVSAAAAA